MKFPFKGVIAPFCLLSLIGSLAWAVDREIEFSAYSDSWDTDVYNVYSPDYDVSVLYLYSGVPEGFDVWFGVKDDFPTESLTNRDQTIEADDYFTYAAQWDTSVTPRVSWDPLTADSLIFW